MVRFDGSLARSLDFGNATTNNPLARRRLVDSPPASRPRLGLLRGPDKYKALEKRRRAAQIKARHVLDLIAMMEARPEGAEASRVACPERGEASRGEGR
jgi:hypothetical protein